MNVDENDIVSTYLLEHHIPTTNDIICNLIRITEISQGCYFKGQWDTELVGIIYSEVIGTNFKNPNLSIIQKSCEHMLPFNTKLLQHIMISILLLKQYHIDEVNTLKISIM